MKKTFPVNINGKVFYIDEDAYELLQNYLDQLRSAFTGSEGDEIVNDIESRISELFEERISAGANAIVHSDVNSIIEIMGKPSDISENEYQTENQCENNHTTTQFEHNTTADRPQVRKHLYRNVHDKVFGGVIGGLATYLGWDTNIMRLLYVVLALITYFWPLTLLYLIAWMVIPAANTPRRILEQQGDPITVDNIGQSVLSRTTPPPYHQNSGNIFNTIFSIIGKCIMVLIGLIGSAGALVAAGFILFFTIALIAYVGFNDITILGGFYFDYYHCAPHYTPTIFCIASIFFTLCFVMPAIALAWAAAAVLFDCKGAAKTTIITASVLEVIIIVITIVLWLYTNSLLYHHF